MKLERNISRPWSPESWRRFPARQQPVYEDRAGLEKTLRRLHRLPGLVGLSAVEDLRGRLGEVAGGRGFLLHGGDCAEAFRDVRPGVIRANFRLLLAMAVIVAASARLPVVRIGRMAGQYAKPRSDAFEDRDGLRLPSYRGDIINRVAFGEAARRPDPTRMLEAYGKARETLDQLAELAGRPWPVKDLAPEPLDGLSREHAAALGELLEPLERTEEFLQTWQGGKPGPLLDAAPFFTSHEALLLPYESALTRSSQAGKIKAGPGHFDASAHFLWIGDRTRAIDGAHIEFARGIANPVGLKLGPSIEVDDLLQLIETLNPHNQPGRLSLICRFGARNIEGILPNLIRAVGSEGRQVIWVSDPMHGNTIRTGAGLKTRPFELIIQELERFFDIHAQAGTHPGGVHLELTGQDVTECTGGAIAVTEEKLSNRYHTHCDPRLNPSQSLELAFLVAEHLNAFGRAGKDLEAGAAPA